MLLIKKIKLETKTEENIKIREILLERVNKLVEMEQDKEKEIVNIINRENSPIKRMAGLISRVEEVRNSQIT